MSDVSYLTAEGAEKMQKELADLKGPKRDALAARLRFAIQQGDLSENADYIQAKEEQGFLEGRIHELDSVLKNVVIIEKIWETRSRSISVLILPSRKKISIRRHGIWLGQMKLIRGMARSRMNLQSGKLSSDISRVTLSM